MNEGYLKGKLDVNWWQTQLAAGIKFREKYTHEKRWPTWRKYYRGDWRQDIMPSNLYFKMLRTTVPRIYFRNPSISIQATKPGLENMLFSQLLERIDNKLIKRMKIKQQFKRIVQDAFMFGTGIGKLGYGAEFTPTPELLRTEKPYDVKGSTIEYNSNVQANMPWFMRVHTGAFIVPPGLNYFDDSRYCAHWIRRSLQDVKDDPRLDYVSGLKGGTKGTFSSMGAANENNSYSNPVEMIDLFEIRDKKTGMVFVIAPYATDRVLYKGVDDLQVGGRLPFFTVSFNEDDEVFWGVPDSKILEPLQLELNENRTQIMWHRRLSVVKALAKKKALSEEQKLKLISEEILPIIEIDGDPLTDIKFLEGSNIPNDLFTAYENTIFDARETVGFSRNEFGEFNSRSGDTSATEAQIVKMASEIRVDERRDMMADMLVDVIQHTHQVVFEKWTEEEVIDIMGPNGLPVWVRFKPAMLKTGQYEVSVDPDTSVPDTKDARQNKALQIYSMFKDDPLIDPIKLRRYMLHEMHGVAFDDMIMLPGQLGSQQNPMDIAQVSQLFQQAANSGGKR